MSQRRLLGKSGRISRRPMGKRALGFRKFSRFQKSSLLARRTMRRRRFGRRRFFRRRNRFAFRKARKTSVKVPGVGEPFPDRYLVKLRYQDPYFLRSNASAFEVTWRYRMNGAYDILPEVGSTAMPGFTKLATEYGKYLVSAFKYDITICNNEANQLFGGVVWTNTDIGFNNVNFWSLLNNRNARRFSIMPKGSTGQRIRIRGYIDLARLTGKNEYNTDSDYSAPSNTNPANILFFNVGVFSPISSSIMTSAGIFVNAYFTYYITFFEKKPLQNLTEIVEEDVPNPVEGDPDFEPDVDYTEDPTDTEGRPEFDPPPPPPMPEDSKKRKATCVPMDIEEPVLKKIKIEDL